MIFLLHSVVKLKQRLKITDNIVSRCFAFDVAFSLSLALYFARRVPASMFTFRSIPVPFAFNDAPKGHCFWVYYALSIYVARVLFGTQGPLPHCVPMSLAFSFTSKGLWFGVLFALFLWFWSSEFSFICFSIYYRRPNWSSILHHCIKASETNTCSSASLNHNYTRTVVCMYACTHVGIHACAFVCRLTSFVCMYVFIYVCK